MSDFTNPGFVTPARPFYTPLSLQSVPECNGGESVIAWPSANLSIYIPFYLDTTITLGMMWIANGTISGNVDVGIYDEYANLISSAGSTANAGSNGPQKFTTVTPTLNPGTYYMAMACNNGTATFLRWNVATIGLVGMPAMGIQVMTGAFPLPSVAFWTNPTTAYIPIMGFTTGVTVI